MGRRGGSGDGMTQDEGDERVVYLMLWRGVARRRRRQGSGEQADGQSRFEIRSQVAVEDWERRRQRTEEGKLLCPGVR